MFYYIHNIHYHNSRENIIKDSVGKLYCRKPLNAQSFNHDGFDDDDNDLSQAEKESEIDEFLKVLGGAVQFSRFLSGDAL